MSLFLIRGVKFPECVCLVPINALTILKGRDGVGECALLISLCFSGVGTLGAAHISGDIDRCLSLLVIGRSSSWSIG